MKAEEKQCLFLSKQPCIDNRNGHIQKWARTSLAVHASLITCSALQSPASSRGCFIGGSDQGSLSGLLSTLIYQRRWGFEEPNTCLAAK